MTKKPVLPAPDSPGYWWRRRAFSDGTRMDWVIEDVGEIQTRAGVVLALCYGSDDGYILVSDLKGKSKSEEWVGPIAKPDIP